MTRVALYLRQSSDPQGTELAVDRQRSNCLARAEARGWNVDEADIYVDNNFSASSDRERPAYQRLIADIKRGKFDVVIAWNLDRLTRKPREIEDWIDLNSRYGINLMTSEGSDPVDMGTEVGRLILRITAAVARQEVERKGRRQRESNEQARAMGFPPHGKRAFGYTARSRDARSITKTRTGADGRTYVDYGHAPIPREAEEIRRGFELIIQGETAGVVARAWNAAGILNTRGNPWTPASVLGVLTSPRYAGFSVPPRGHHAWRKSLYDPLDLTSHRRGTWEPIVSAETWTTVQGLIRDLSARDLLGTPKRWLLSGLATCAVLGDDLKVCGAPIMGGATYAKVKTYRCSAAGHLMRRADLVEELVVARIVELALGSNGRSLARYAPNLAVAGRERRLRKALNELSEEYRVLVLRGMLTEQEAEKKARAHRGRLRGELSAVRREVRGTATDAFNVLLRAGRSRPNDTHPWTAEVRVMRTWASLPLSARRQVVEAAMSIELEAPGRGNGRPGPRTEDRLALAAQSVRITLRQPVTQNDDEIGRAAV